MTLRMKYPSINQFIETNFDVNEDPKENVNKTFKIISECIDTIYTQEDVGCLKIIHQMKEFNSLNN